MCVTMTVLRFFLSFPVEIAVISSLSFGLLALRLVIEVRIHHQENHFGKILFRFYILLILIFGLIGAFFLIRDCNECVKNPPSS